MSECNTIWFNVFFYLFIISLIVNFMVIRFYTNRKKNDDKEYKMLQQQYIAKIDLIREEKNQSIDNLRSEMLKKEEERTRQWIESEKETLHVLSGVTQMLKLGESLNKIESEKILSKLNEIIEIIKHSNE